MDIPNLISGTGLTDRELAKELGATVSMVWKWRNGKNLPSAPYLVRLLDRQRAALKRRKK